MLLLNLLSFFSILGLTQAVLIRPFTCPGDAFRALNLRCCHFYEVVEDLKMNLFKNRCGGEAHAVLRLTFHDAIGISSKLGGGGADGSILVYREIELQDRSNAGLKKALDILEPYVEKYPKVSPGDMIQLAGAVSLTVCPGAPRISFFAGRPYPRAPAPPGLIPGHFHDVSTILARLGDVGFLPHEVVALLASHSIAGAHNVDTTVPGAPLDSTHDQFDTQFYLETLLAGSTYPGTGAHFGEVPAAIPGTVRLASDHKIARDPRTSCAWQSMINNQSKMKIDFAAAMVKMSLLGQSLLTLIDCSEVIPDPLALRSRTANYPPEQRKSNVETTCKILPFPNLSTQPGPATAVSPIPQI